MKNYVMSFILLEILKMKNFKFLSNKTKEDSETFESLIENGYIEPTSYWVWGKDFFPREFLSEFETKSKICFGIRDFLDSFPNHTMIPVIEINNGIHRYTGEEGEGEFLFDIHNDIFTIVYVDLFL